MFKELFQRAQRTVDRTIDQVVHSAIVAIPFLIAAGFATATLTLKLTQEFGVETGYLLMAALFSVIGLVTFGIVSLRPQPSSEAAQHEEAQPETETAEAKRMFDGLSTADKELLLSSLTSVAPFALPAVLRLVTRNLPVLVAVGAAVVFLFRGQIFQGSETGTDSAGGASGPESPEAAAASAPGAMAA